ncbi:MAG: hypothetical protein ABIJ08_05770 [Nanoarchaeota archaeon]
MKNLVFDSGAIISLTLNNLIWILEPLKKSFKGNFYITEPVKRELVDRPLEIKRFEFEALQALRYVENKTIEVIQSYEIKKLTDELLDLANNSFIAKGKPLRIVHPGEISGIAVCIHLNSNIFAVDERTLRLLIEDPRKLRYILEHRLHTKVDVNKANLKRFGTMTKKIKLIRSVELVTIAYEKGLLDVYIPNMPYGKKKLLESVLWGVKLSGCSVSKSEIEQVMRIER